MPTRPGTIATPPHSTQLEIEASLNVLLAHQDAWVALEVPERIAILAQLQQDMLAIADRWVASGLAAKGLAAGAFGEAEEWLFLGVIFRALRLLSQSLAEIQQSRRPRIAGEINRNQFDQLTARVFPLSSWDRLLFRGITGEVWFEPGLTAGTVRREQARRYQDKRYPGAIALVLGAGNASMIPVIDTLHKLFVDDQVVVLKPNPINAYLGPLIEAGLRTLIQRGFLQVVYGGAAEGAYLCNHPAVTELHLTGSIKTFEAITYGPGAEGERRKALRTPLLSKRFTCELGNVGPVIIVPGPWQAQDVQEQAEQIATWFVANAGFGCVIPRLIIQQQSWPLRPKLISAIKQVLSRVSTRLAYYPGAAAMHAAFVAAHPEASQIGHTGPGHLPWTFITGLDPDKTDDICFRQEAFCSLFAETALAASDVPAFIQSAVEFANTTLWGTLHATLIVHPKSLQDPQIAEAIERAVADLRYGSVLVNMGPFAGYYLLVTPWGGFPGQDLADIQSGAGKTANLLMLEGVQKSVIRGPFYKPFDPLRVTSRRAAEFCRKLAYFEASPSPWKAPGLVWASLRG